MSPPETNEAQHAMRQAGLSTGHVVRVAVHDRGAGPAAPRCLLVHGNPGSMDDWRHVVGPLAEVAEVAVVDMPGFGGSPRPTAGAAEMGLDHLADDAVAIADFLGWGEPFFIVGHSHGGGVAQCAASRHPDRIAGIVLIATLGAPAHWSYRLLALPGMGFVARALGRVLGFRWARPLARWLVRRSMVPIFHPEAVEKDEVDTQLELLVATPPILSSMVDVACGDPSTQLLGAASSIRCPVMFVHGDSDRLVHRRHAEAIHERIVSGGGTSSLRVVTGAGHMVPVFQAPWLASVLRDFVGGHAGRAPGSTPE